MTRQPEDNLENFFLNRVNEYEIDYREEDWLKLNEMLDAASIVKTAALKQKIIWAASGALLILSIGLLVWFGNTIKEAFTGNNDSPQITESSSSGQIHFPVDSTDLSDKLNSDQEAVFIEGTDNDNNTNRTGIEGEIEDEIEITGKQVNSDLQNSDNPITDIENSVPLSVTKIMADTNQDPSGKETEEYTETPSAIWPESKNLPESTRGENRESVPIYLHPGGFDLVNENSSYSIDSSSVGEVKNIELRKNYAWNISLATDYSAVGMSDFTGPRLRAGLSAEYYFSDKVSIMAGVNYSIKEYTAFGNEYKVPSNYWNGGVVPDETFGSCNVLDIPITFTYYIPNKSGQFYFVRAGISSWLMLEEHYYFRYASNDPDLIGYWGGKNENYHYFSIFDLSAGFEYPLGSKFSILAEPYLNIPLGGVGYGHVKLYSGGLRFTMKINHYKLVTSGE